jgi:hypothetical protein
MRVNGSLVLTWLGTHVDWASQPFVVQVKGCLLLCCTCRHRQARDAGITSALLLLLLLLLLLPPLLLHHLLYDCRDAWRG